ncbi:hypothetical protein V1508DRAFT_458703 [Lipomyces doorenjongii]|uniref:uncharacterized protein n=1 Tax=Lipomyces doorenjongii TaxID=383834 RepID=UPI0034CFE59F
MTGSRAIGRDIHFYHFAEPDKALAGGGGGGKFWSASNKMNFLSIFAILIVASGVGVISRNGDTISMTDELATTTGRDERFRTQGRLQESLDSFPCRPQDYFVQNGFSRINATRGINPCQNGLLMQKTVSILCLTSLGFRRGVLDTVCRDPADERSARDELLRWHFRQAALANMSPNGNSQSHRAVEIGTVNQMPITSQRGPLMCDIGTSFIQ